MRPRLRAPTVAVLGCIALSCLALGACTDSDGGLVGGSADDGERTAETTTAPTPTSASSPCSDVTVTDASDYQHVEPGTDMDYEGVPPVAGDHWSTWEDIVKPVYTIDERPDLGQLVHSQEHGWTIIWYDESIDPDDLEEVAAEVVSGGAQKVVFMPWTEEDGEPFPGDASIAMTHWGYEDDPGEEYRQFCTEPDAEAILAFVERYPYTNSREPDAP